MYYAAWTLENLNADANSGQSKGEGGGTELPHLLFSIMCSSSPVVRQTANSKENQ